MRQVKPALQYSDGRSKPWSGASLVNCFCEKADGDRSVDFAVMAIPGLVLFSDISNSPIRGTHTMGGMLFVVAGVAVHKISQGGGAVFIGAITPGGPVTMADNGTQLAICSSSIGYVYDGSSITSPAGLPAVSDVTFIDGYIVWSVANSDQFVYSAIGNALLYDGLDVATVEGAPDNIVAVINSHRELVFFGERTTEIWYNSGDADNPFQRQGNAFLERGCFDRDSIAMCGNSIHFLGDDRIVYRLVGYEPQRISTHAIEYRLRDCVSARGFSYTQEGHKFYGITTESCTLLIDLATGTWHERKSFGLDNWRISGCEDAFGTSIFCDGTTGKLYTASLDVFTENGETIPVEIGLPTLETGTRDRLTLYAFEVYCETGIGLSDGADPQMLLTYSDNGGRTWSNEIARGMGVVGDYSRRAIWRNLGRFRQRDIKLKITDPVRRLVLSYYADMR